MRTLLFTTLVLGGCLSAPTGRDPGAIDAPIDSGGVPWPPPSAEIAAVASGDLDGDGKDDLIAADVDGARIHWLRGGEDIDPTSSTVDTSTANAQLPGLARPVAVRVVSVGGARFVVVLDTPGSGPRVTVFDMQLSQTGTAMLEGTAMPAPEDIVTITPSTFGPEMNATFLTVPDAVFFIEGATLDDDPPQVMILPPDTGTMFEEVRGATGWVGNPPNPQIAVAELQRAQRATAMGPGQFTWTTVRPDTNVDWQAQTIADIDNDQFPDVIAFEPNGGNPANICVLDAQAGMLPTCFATPYGMDMARMVTGSVAAMNQVDLVLTDARPPGTGMTNVFVVERLRFGGGAVMADVATMPLEVDLPEALPAVLQLDSGPAEIVLVGKNGQVACVRPTTGNNPPAPCAQ